MQAALQAPVRAQTTLFTCVRARASLPRLQSRSTIMGINKPSDIAANLQIGPTDAGMVRIFVEAEGGIELPLDFDPEEADEIAEELRAAAEAARAMQAGSKKR